MLVAPAQFYELLQAPHKLVDLRPAAQFRKGTFESATHLSPDSLSSLAHEKADVPLLMVADPLLQETLLSELPKGIMLKGGYPAYLEWQDAELSKAGGMIVLGGKTGSGKTQLLQLLAQSGEQVIDLEQLAEHRGSVFGNLEGHPQPSPSAFRHRLFDRWYSRDPHRLLWVEEEGPFLGSVAIPSSWYDTLQHAPMLEIELPFSIRLDAIVATYGHHPIEALRAATRKLEERMGMSANHRTLHLLNKGEVRAAFELLLHYYDSAYDQRRSQHWKGIATTVALPSNGHQQSLEKVLLHARELLQRAKGIR